MHRIINNQGGKKKSLTLLICVGKKKCILTESQTALIPSWQIKYIEPVKSK